ncbi:hypothetical protein CC79DRAFT_1361872 [Sarocladium strictum]
MIFPSVALLVLAGVAAAAPAETIAPADVTNVKASTYTPCLAWTPKCCPDNPIGFFLFGPPSLECEDPASVASESKFEASCDQEKAKAYCCSPEIPLVGSACRKVFI